MRNLQNNKGVSVYMPMRASFIRNFYRRAVFSVVVLTALTLLAIAGSGCSMVKEFTSPEGKAKVKATLRLSKDLSEKFNIDCNLKYQVNTFNGEKKKLIIVMIETSKTENELKNEIEGITNVVKKTPEFSDCDAMQIVLSQTNNYGVASTTQSNSLEPIPIKTAQGDKTNSH